MSIRRTDSTNVQDTLKNTYLQGFELTDYDDSATIALAAGNSERLDGDLYIVESGDQTITDSGLLDGTVFVHVKDGGAGIATAYLDTNSGTWDANKKGYYHTDGAKVIYKMEKSGASYLNKKRISGYGDKDARGEETKLVSGGEVVELSTPSMNVQVNGGTAVVNERHVVWGDQTISVSAPGSNTRLDYVCIDEFGVLSLTTGTAAASPDFPAFPADKLIVGALAVKNTTTSINTGKECFSFKKGGHQFFPNLYINANYTATNKSHNNVIIDLTGSITGTLVCQGNCWVVNYDGSGTDGVGEGQLGPFTGGYDSDTNWYIRSASHLGTGIGQALQGSGGSGVQDDNTYPYYGTLGTSASSITIQAYNIYVWNIDTSGGDGGNGTTAYDPNTDDTDFPAGKFEIGSAGGDGGGGASINLEAVSIIEIYTGATMNTSGGDGGNGKSVSGGSVGNLGGQAGWGKNAGSLTLLAKTITDNGTTTQTAGAAGAAGTGSGGSDNNANGTSGSAGSAGSKTSTEYDFTTGVVAGYADWVHPLYMEVGVENN